MRPKLKFALALLPLWFAVAASAAQSQAQSQSESKPGVDYTDAVLVSAEQGQALADFALQSGQRVRPKPDCSHLVHLLYARAGLIYPYEDSRVLYRGVDNFERVKTPQPGDLVVWLGHVGIVLSPEEKMFLSSVRSGIITESWHAAHWARRGRPRFLRYRIGPSANLTLLAAIMGDSTTVRNEDTQTADVRTPDSRTEAVRNEERREDAHQADAEKSESEDTRPHAVAADDLADDSTALVAVMHQRQTPSKREIVAAILESSNARAQSLIAGRTLDMEHPISVFDHVEVARIKMKQQSGSVTLKLSETMSQEDGRVLAGRMIERELSIFRRDGVWVISDPRRRAYLPQSQALAVFEHQTEFFLRRAPNSSGTRAVVKVLDRLYDQQPGAPQRAAR
jgi:hypothetical protein